MSDTIVCLAADHNGVGLKAKIKASLVKAGIRALDLGPYTSETSVDYIDYAQLVGTLIQNGDCDRGILICGTGIGMSISANKLPKVRAAVVHNYESAGKCREHNDANVLCLGAWICTTTRISRSAAYGLRRSSASAGMCGGWSALRPIRGEKWCSPTASFDILHQDISIS